MVLQLVYKVQKVLSYHVDVEALSPCESICEYTTE